MFLRKHEISQERQIQERKKIRCNQSLKVERKTDTRKKELKSLIESPKE